MAVKLAAKEVTQVNNWRYRNPKSPSCPMRTLSSIEDLNFAAAMPTRVIVQKASDHVLLEETLAGDEDAFAELVSRYRNQITSYIYRMTNDYDGAVDLAQETFLRVYRAASRYQTTHAFSTYIYRIATNLAISELRKRKRRRLVSLTGLLSSADGEEMRDFDAPDEKPLQDTNLVDSEIRRVVKRAIGTLPEKYRAPLVLRDVEGKSYEEIAEILQTSEGTVKSRINRARNFLRDKMRNYV
jgi:RNA polymerase sigma-70 factor, ECF subfamily